MNPNQSTVQKQFGANAAKYATSQVHAQGDSLARLLELTQPQPHWQVLDIATGAGHTALAFAPHVVQVWATDLTYEMLTVAGNLAQKRALSNIYLAQLEAAHLPYADNSFDLVTCRIAPHHFPNVAAFVRESVRVLRRNGILAVVDNVVPGSGLKGKKGKQLRDAGIYVNAIEKLRDPSHEQCLSINEWITLFQQQNLHHVQHETSSKTIQFHDWASRMNVQEPTLTQLQALFVQAPQAVQEFLQTQLSPYPIRFQLHEILVVGTKASR